jgi:hypothetical protein
LNTEASKAERKYKQDYMENGAGTYSYEIIYGE